jgi:DNA-binding NarL/FixJ family response regulator
VVSLEEFVDMEAVKVLIADDVAQVRQDLRLALDLAGGIKVIGEATDGRQAVELAARLKPQVLLLDLEMPVLDGWEAARQVRATCPACRLVALTVHGDDGSRRQALAAGIDDFVVKGAGLEALLEAVLDRKE